MKSKKRQAEERNAALTKTQEVLYKEEFKSANGREKNEYTSQTSSQIK
ncbi:YfhE-like protein [Fictibacillus solisalsi]|uniref:YfhE-like protein n=1 Tax=Fictibacillus solisalsi TaxID=459525 RepID=A0A1H0AEW5_9BACL|nr:MULTISPECIES: YfhE family protein [Fictibacillus]SCC32404.1 YfhE-like protein [Fictibacillus enclensis]SDN31874.1 YfhE-like protein [Fictibacillus solisalsi]